MLKTIGYLGRRANVTAAVKLPGIIMLSTKGQ